MRTGFEAVIRKKFADPMPDYVSFETDSLEKMEAFQFDDPWDDRRWFSAGDNQVAGVGDGFTRNSPAWIETVKELHPDFPVYGSICEGHEQLWRIIGTENVMLWIGLYPEELGRFIERLGRFLVEMTARADQGRRRAPGRHGDLGGRGLRQRHALLPGFLAARTSSPSWPSRSASATRRACR